MAMFRISPERLRHSAAKLRANASKIHSALKDSDETISELESQWEGIVQVTGFAEYQVQRQAVLALVSILEDLATELSRISEVFYCTDEEILAGEPTTEPASPKQPSDKDKK